MSIPVVKSPIPYSSRKSSPVEKKDEVTLTEQILKEWKINIGKILTDFLDKLSCENIEIVLQKDDYCSTKGMKKMDIRMRNQMCKNCGQIMALVPNICKVDEINKFFVGPIEDTNFTISTYPFFNTKYVKNKQMNKNFFEQEISQYIQFVKDPATRYSIDDLNFHYCFVNLLAIYNFARKNVKFTHSLLNIYNCSNSLICVEKENIKLYDFFTNSKWIKSYSPLASSANKKEITQDITKDILKQIILQLYFLSTYSFVHGEPSVNNIYIEEKDVTSSFQGIYVKSQISANIKMSKYSSMTIKNDKKETINVSPLINTDYIPMLFENIDFEVGESFNTSKNKLHSDSYMSKRIVFYKIGYRKESFLGNVRKYSLHGISKSFDVVMFICSIMSIDIFYYSVLNSPQLEEIWKGLFMKKEYENINIDILKTKYTFEDLYTFMCKYHIRTDALEYLHSKMIGISQK